MKWKNKFTNIIRQRGEAIYNNGNIYGFQIKNDVIYADVDGTDFYEVMIKLKNGNIKKMSCTCPYARKGNNCKHMAAVLYNYEDRLLDETNNLDYYLEDIENKLGKLDKKAFYDYLYSRYLFGIIADLIYDGELILAFDLIHYILLLADENTFFNMKNNYRFINLLNMRITNCIYHCNDEEYYYIFYWLNKERKSPTNSIHLKKYIESVFDTHYRFSNN